MNFCDGVDFPIAVVRRRARSELYARRGVVIVSRERANDTSPPGWQCSVITTPGTVRHKRAPIAHYYPEVATPFYSRPSSALISHYRATSQPCRPAITRLFARGALPRLIYYRLRNAHHRAVRRRASERASLVRRTF